MPATVYDRPHRPTRPPLVEFRKIRFQLAFLFTCWRWLTVAYALFPLQTNYGDGQYRRTYLAHRVEVAGISALVWVLFIRPAPAAMGTSIC